MDAPIGVGNPFKYSCRFAYEKPRFTAKLMWVGLTLASVDFRVDSDAVDVYFYMDFCAAGDVI